ncbi:hypothetical protein H4R18_003013 [Coemansia javaensis]|uniref:Uncharacterized protein n=1 Tax=Coemansia javaensis TaxID=2761396 RepID=A0A9W8HFY4_9FUNG|nr:hypothetical protein H4R18_003013 [Coemansia javaensis]
MLAGIGVVRPGLGRMAWHGRAVWPSQKTTTPSRAYYHRRGPRRLWWALARPALVAAGCAALVTVAWPVVRLAVAGALGYGAYRAVRAALELRGLRGAAWSRVRDMAAAAAALGVDARAVEAARAAAEAAVRAACASAPAAQQAVGADPARVTLGAAVDLCAAAAAPGAARVEAVFPLLVDAAPTPVFVRACFAPPAAADALHILARRPSGDVAAIEIDPAAAWSPPPPPRAHRPVRDADYREL